jgi:hypothetical protein
MPRYFFNIGHSAEMPDVHGVELPGLDEARRTARSIANELSRNRQAVRKPRLW